MFFGQYLINKKLIDENELIDALIFQIHQSPSVLSILKNDLNIASSELLKLIALQFEKQQDTVTAAQAGNLIESEVLCNALNIQNQRKEPIGQILVKRGNLTSEQLKSTLEEYLSSTPDMVKVEESKTTEIDNPALETLRQQVAEGSMPPEVLAQLEQELGLSVTPQTSEEKPSEGYFASFLSSKLDLDFYDELMEAITTPKIVTINNQILDLSNPEKCEEINSASLKVDLKEMKGSARLGGANFFEDIIGRLEQYVTKVADGEAPALEKDINHLLQSFLDLKLTLEREQSELPYLNNSKACDSYFNSLKNLNLI